MMNIKDAPRDTLAESLATIARLVIQTEDAGDCVREICCILGVKNNGDLSQLGALVSGQVSSGG